MYARRLHGVSALAVLAGALAPPLTTGCGSSEQDDLFGDGAGGEGRELRDAPGTTETSTTKESTSSGGSDGDTGTGGASAVAIDCGDKNPCTLDSFDGTNCVHEPATDGSPCDDGDLCTMGDSCQAGVCEPGTVSPTSFGELSRLSTYGTGYGIAAGTGGGQFVFVDPLDRGTALTVARVTPSGTTLEGESWQFSDETYRPSIGASTALAVGWPGYAAIGTSLYRGEMTLVTVTDDGTPTLHGTLKLPESDPPFVSSSQLNGLVGQGDSLWACGNLSVFFGSVRGTIYHYDLSNPDNPTLVESYPMDTSCGSVAVAEDGGQIFVNTVAGIRWFEPNALSDSGAAGAGGTAAGDVVWHEAFGENSGLLVVGDRLMSRTNESVTIYSRADQSQLSQRTIENLRGVAHIAELDLLVALHFPPIEPGATTYARKLLLLDAAPDADLALLDEIVLAHDVSIDSRTLAVSGSVVVDQVSKAVYDVSTREFVGHSSPQRGEITALTRRDGQLVTWGNYSRLTVDTSTINSPSWLESGRQDVGMPESISLVLDQAQRTLVATPNDVPSAENDRLIINFATPRRDGGVRLISRNAETGAPTRTVLLAGVENGILHWAGDSLYHFEYDAIEGALFSRWDSAALMAGEQSVAPASATSLLPAFRATESITRSETFVVAPDETWAFVAISQVFAPDESSTEESGLDLTAAWIDLTQNPPSVMASVDLRGDRTGVGSCAATRTQAFCTGVAPQFYERQEGDSEVQVTFSDAALGYAAAFALDNGWVYLADDDGLRRAPFGFSQADYDAAPLISLASTPTTIASLPNGMAVASRNELVFINPECAEEPVLIDSGMGAGGAGNL